MEPHSVATSTVEEGQRALAGHDEYLFPCAKPLYRSPLVLEEGEGVLVRDSDPDRAVAILEAAKDEGLLVGLGGLHGHVIRIGPSLLITEDELAEGVERLARACARADGESS